MQNFCEIAVAVLVFGGIIYMTRLPDPIGKVGWVRGTTRGPIVLPWSMSPASSLLLFLALQKEFMMVHWMRKPFQPFSLL